MEFEIFMDDKDSASAVEKMIQIFKMNQLCQAET